MGHEATQTSVLVIGGGPAGMAPLLAAAGSGQLSALLEAGLILVEAGPAMGAGGLQDTAIHSDSTAESFLDIVLRNQNDFFSGLHVHPLVSRIAEFAGGAVPLPLVSEFLDVLSEHLAATIQNRPNCKMWTSTNALSTRQSENGEWITETYSKLTGTSRTITSRAVILAMGGHQPESRLTTEIAGQPLLQTYGSKLLQSGYALTRQGMHDITSRLKNAASPKVAIIGGSASAGAVTCFLDSLSDQIPFGAGDITILHRSPLKLSYGSVADALADGYTEFTSTDVCSLTGRVHRFGGFRLGARALIRDAMLAQRNSLASRVKFQRLSLSSEQDSRNILDEASLIIAAIGYRPRLLPVFDPSGRRIALQGETGIDQPLVDSEATVLNARGLKLSGLFGIGLAAGRPWTADLGGELSFKGQINSLWMWQHALGLEVVDAILALCHRQSTSSAECVVPLSSSRERAKASPTGDRPSLDVPFLQPNPPRLSEHLEALQSIERSGIYTNFGPVSTACEQAFVREVFKSGSCVLVCNATIGLMLAIREAVGLSPRPNRRFALMPSFTFPAAAQAALWNGLTPLFCDIDPFTWLPSASSENEALEKYGHEIAVILPCATFGNNLDLHRYERLQRAHAIPVVVDAAASLGSRDANDNAFGAGFTGTVVYSMHATKPFSTGEGGVLYSHDSDRVARLRQMSSFGFGAPRIATMIGLNAKMSEVSALLALKQLERFAEISRRRQAIIDEYARLLPDLVRQQLVGRAMAHSFETVLLPPRSFQTRVQTMQHLTDAGITTATYFSPHLAEQSFWQENGKSMDLSTTDDIAHRILNLPMSELMTQAEVTYVGNTLATTLADESGAARPRESRVHRFLPTQRVPVPRKSLYG